jgi:fatty acid desaturase
MMETSTILPRKPGLFRYSRWDAVPVLMAVVHLLYLFAMYAAFTRLHLPLPARIAVMAAMGIIYSFSISWNINGISHNFIHNRYFNSGLLNRIFSLLESADCCFSQILYDYIHRRHHMGNSDKPDESGETLDWLSIYRHGHDGHAENVWTFTFLSFFRDDPKATWREVRNHSAAEAGWAIAEVTLTGTIMIGLLLLNWKFFLFFLPFWYFGHCLSYLNGYFEHFGGNPELPIAWGVSSYNKLYNWVWFNNGFHAEHHYRPRAHWTRMKTLHDQIERRQRENGVRVIKPPHALGFLDPDVCDEPLARSTPAALADAPASDDLVDITRGV